MRTQYLAISVILGIALTIGIIVALGAGAPSAEAQSIPSLGTAAAVDHGDEISKALDYISQQQNPDGGIPWLSADSDVGATARGVLGLVATGRPASWMAHSTSSKTMVDFLTTNGLTYTHGSTPTISDNLVPENAGLLVAALSAANEDPTNLGGVDLIAHLNAVYNPATGAYSTTHEPAGDLQQAWAILGLAAAGEPVPVTATAYLTGLQAADGTWAAYGSSDPDTTALAMGALVGSGNVPPTDPAIQKALDYFRDTQLPSGGWRPWWDTDPANADTTAWVIQGLVAAGYTPATESWAASPNPHDVLVALQHADGRIGGAWANAYSTIEALFGLTEQPLYFLGRQHRALRALTWLNEQQNADGSWDGWFGPDTGATCDGVLAYAAAGYDPYGITAAGSVTSAMDYISATASTYANGAAAAAGKLVLAVEAAGGDAHDIGGIDAVYVLTNTWYSPTVGAFGVPTNTYHQAFPILGLAAAGEAVPVSATQTLTGLQQPDGGWKYDTGPYSPFSDPDSTGLALQALAAAGVGPTDPSIVAGVQYLKNQRNSSGSWDFWGSPSPNSTAYAMQGLLAAGQDLEADEWLQNGPSPYDALAGFQKVDGPFASGGVDNLLGTSQAVPALLGQAYPLPSGGLVAFQGINRGPDPDRTVAVPPRPDWGNSVDVTVPFGSDLDSDGTVTLDWRVSGATAWVTGTVLHEADGYYTATLPLTQPVAYEFRATFTDRDDVQYGSGLDNTVVLSTTLEPYDTYLPLVLNQ